jgi:hypothetical protein
VISVPAIVVTAGVLAVVANYMLADYFERTFLDEASPLAAAEPTESFATPGNQTPAIPATPTAPPEDEARSPAGVLATGMFRDGAPGHNGEGTAAILRDETGKLFLRFEDFSVTNGPDLYVVLTPDADGGSYRNGLLLGENRATDGNINYEIPDGTDVSQFMSVIIWCRQFDVVFAVATLEAV